MVQRSKRRHGEKQKGSLMSKRGAKRQHRERQGVAYVQAMGQKGGIKRNREGRLCPREGQRGSIERDRGDRLWGSRGVKGTETGTVKTKRPCPTKPCCALKLTWVSIRSTRPTDTFHVFSAIHWSDQHTYASE